MTVINTDAGRMVSQIDRGKNYNFIAIDGGPWVDSQVLGPFTNPVCKGVRAMMHIASVTTGYDATATATLVADGVGSIAVDTVGNGYASAPTVVITGGGGTGAAATAHLTGATVTTVTVDTAGTGYTTAPTISFTGGGTNGTIKLGIETAELQYDDRHTLLESATRNSTGAGLPYTVYPNIAAVANSAVSNNVGDGFYIRITHSAPGQWQYTVTVQYLA